MSLRVSSTVPGPSGLAQPRDGQRLAGSLRVCRLTTLYGVAGGGKSTLLKNDVLPMLHRRATDVAVPHGLAPRVVIPFADRRRGPSAFGGARSAEVAVLFDAWTGEPLTELLAQVHEAMGIAAPAPTSARVSLAGSLAALNMQFGARFLVILDQFEACLAAAEQSPAVREFLDQLVQSLNRPLLPVNFLIAVREESRPMLEELRARVPGFDDQSLQLGAPPGARTPLRRVPASPNGVPPDIAAPTPAGPTAADAVTSDVPTGRAPADADAEWHRSLGAIVQRAAGSARQEAEPTPGTAVPPDPGPGAPRGRFAPPAPGLEPDVTVWPDAAAEDDGEPAFAATTSAAEREDDDDPPHFAERARALALAKMPAPASAKASTLSRKAEIAVWVTAGAMLLGYGTWLLVVPRGQPVDVASAAPRELPPMATTATPTPAPSPVPVPVPVPSPVPAVPAAPALARAPADIDATPRTLTELAGVFALALPAGAGGVTAADWPAGFSAVPGAPRFAVARYDALQAARREAGTAPLQVLAPLYTEPVYFVVRADSPMNHIHDIEGAAVNGGPADAGRGVTAAAIYRRLFDKPLPDGPSTGASANAAIGQLLGGQGVDVVVLAGPQPSAWLAGLPPATARAVKVLKLDPNNAADQRVLQAYLPATLRAGPAEGTPGLAVMSFLVAADAEDGLAGVKALCAGLPALQQTGDPKWRELQAGLQLDVGWPASPAAQQAWRACAASRS